ncbi:MAG: hypothetical protein WAV54_07985 [Acidimicrobiales bacterium]
MEVSEIALAENFLHNPVMTAENVVRDFPGSTMVVAMALTGTELGIQTSCARGGTPRRRQAGECLGGHPYAVAALAARACGAGAG